MVEKEKKNWKAKHRWRRFGKQNIVQSFAGYEQSERRKKKSQKKIGIVVNEKDEKIQQV